MKAEYLGLDFIYYFSFKTKDCLLFGNFFLIFKWPTLMFLYWNQPISYIYNLIYFE